MQFKYRFSFIFAIIFFVCAQVYAQSFDDVLQVLQFANFQIPQQETEPDDFTLMLLDGGDVTLSAYRGKVVILNFWVSGCSQCREEKPSMEKLYQRFKDQGLELLAINHKEDTAAVSQFINENGYTFRVPMDRDGLVSETYNITGFPYSCIIDRRGKIIATQSRKTNWNTPLVAAAIKALLNFEIIDGQ